MGVSLGNLQLSQLYQGYIMLGDQRVWPIFLGEESAIFVLCENWKINPETGAERTSYSLFKINKEEMNISLSNIDIFEPFGLYNEWVKGVSYSDNHLYIAEYTSGTLYKIDCQTLEIVAHIKSDFIIGDLSLVI